TLVDARRPPSNPLSSRFGNIGIMRRIFLLLLTAAPLLVGSVGLTAHAAVRGNLVYDNIPEVPQHSADRLDSYLSARQATPLGWTPKGQLLIATRFGDVDQLPEVDL